jgi:hypothetical protein
MQLDDALGRISEIRAQLAHTETFRGLRSLTVASSGVLGLIAAAFQPQHVPQPRTLVFTYIDLWVCVAVISLITVGIEFAYRRSVSNSPLKKRLMVLTIQQFVPCLVAGAALTAIIAYRAREVAWMLPGLWAVCFSLGVFASCRLLPRPIFLVGVYYLVSGSVVLALGDGPHALSPWMMVGTFGVGQLLASGILYCSLERKESLDDA